MTQLDSIDRSIHRRTCDIFGKPLIFLEKGEYKPPHSQLPERWKGKGFQGYNRIQYFTKLTYKPEGDAKESKTPSEHKYGFGISSNREDLGAQLKHSAKYELRAQMHLQGNRTTRVENKTYGPGAVSQMSLTAFARSRPQFKYEFDRCRFVSEFSTKNAARSSFDTGIYRPSSADIGEGCYESTALPSTVKLRQSQSNF